MGPRAARGLRRTGSGEPRPTCSSAGHFDSIGNVKTSEAVAALAALAQETRLKVYRRLVQAGVAGLPAGRIAVDLGLAAPTLSFHLAHLHRAGLVSRRREGRSLVYAASYAAMNGLMGFLTERCCGGDVASCVTAVPVKATARNRRRRSAA
jgi:ArsR family transcriptional regulator